MVKPLNLNIAWVKGHGQIDWSQPNIFFAIGARGSGKSAFGEMCACKTLDAGGIVIDTYGGKDSEGLGFLRSEYVTSGEKKAILFRGNEVEVKSGQENIAASKFRLSDLEKADIFISANVCYSSMDDEFAGVNKILDTVWTRTNWTVPICLVIREAANLIFSRLKLRNSQTVTRAEIAYSCKESRHTGGGIFFDSVKPTSIDIDMRILSDYLVLKNSGMYSLPRDMWWVYRTFSPSAMRQLAPAEFAIIDRWGALGFGTFEMPPFHKTPKENIQKLVGLELQHLRQTTEGDETREIIREAILALPPEAECNQVAQWIKAEKGRSIAPTSIGRQLGELGYITKDVWRDGKVRHLIYPLP